jgi:hypothetical protein
MEKKMLLAECASLSSQGHKFSKADLAREAATIALSEA